MSAAAVIEEHRRAGRESVPTSSFLYRKVLRELAARGLRGIAWDLPGLGLAERRSGFD